MVPETRPASSRVQKLSPISEQTKWREIWASLPRRFFVGAYGLAMLLGQAFLGKLSDRYGRKPVMILGLLLNGTLFPGLIFVHSFGLLFPVAVLAGLGDALFIPAIAASYLDIAEPEHRSQVIGIKGSVVALATVVGPLLITIVSPWTAPTSIFAISAGATLVAILLALVLLKGRSVIEDSKEQVHSIT